MAVKVDNPLEGYKVKDIKRDKMLTTMLSMSVSLEDYQLDHLIILPKYTYDASYNVEC